MTRARASRGGACGGGASARRGIHGMVTRDPSRRGLEVLTTVTSAAARERRG